MSPPRANSAQKGRKADSVKEKAAKKNRHQASVDAANNFVLSGAPLTRDGISAFKRQCAVPLADIGKTQLGAYLRAMNKDGRYTAKVKMGNDVPAMQAAVLAWFDAAQVEEWAWAV